MLNRRGVENFWFADARFVKDQAANDLNIKAAGAERGPRFGINCVCHRDPNSMDIGRHMTTDASQAVIEASQRLFLEQSAIDAAEKFYERLLRRHALPLWAKSFFTS